MPVVKRGIGGSLGLCFCVAIGSFIMSNPAVGQNGAHPITEPVQQVMPRSGQAQGRIEVWVDLAYPAAAASLPPAFGTSRATHGHVVTALQDALASSLKGVGAVERGRVRLVRNALVVEVDVAMLDTIRQMPGVLAVTPVSHRDHTGTAPGVK